MSEKIELKPCPFCKRQHVDFLERMPRVGRINEEARCSNCGATLPIPAWNTRPIEDAQAARIKELERLVDDLRGELAQSDRAADKERIAELKRALEEIANEPDYYTSLSALMEKKPCNRHTKAIAKKALEASK